MSRPADEAIELAFAHGLPFAGLRNHRADPTLTAVVPDELARVARVVVLRADDERVRLAAAVPEPDLSALRDRLAGRTVEIAIAPRDELDALLGPAPEPVPEPAPIEPVAAPEPEPEPAPEPEPEPEPPGEAPSWLTPAAPPSALRAALLVALAFALIAAAVAVMVWLAT
ncbi:MAG: GspE/PulE/PilB domain-containing protein [Solirubrobacteraceae bacterium]